MSLSSVRSYFRSRCLAVGLKEHADAFNEENIASTYLDNSFHVMLNGFSGIKLNQNDQEVRCGVIVSFWIKGFRNPTEGLDRAVSKSELLIKETLKNSNRLGQCLKNVVFLDVAYAALSEDNDNAIKVTLNFEALTILEIE